MPSPPECPQFTVHSDSDSYRDSFAEYDLFIIREKKKGWQADLDALDAVVSEVDVADRALSILRRRINTR
jgi:hypothetical protein